MHFGAAENDEPDQRICDVQVQGDVELENLDVQANVGELVREVENVEVSGNLVIGLAPKAESATSSQMPILTAIEVVRTSPL